MIRKLANAFMPGVVLAITLAAAIGCEQDAQERPEPGQEGAVAQSNITELIKTDEPVGTGNEAAAGRQVTVHYTG